MESNPQKRQFSESSCNGGDANAAPKDLGQVVKSPLDSKRYKVIELRNGLKALLVSTCVHHEQLSRSKDRSFLSKKIQEFDDKHLSVQGGGTLASIERDECNNNSNGRPLAPTKTKQNESLQNFNVLPLPVLTQALASSVSHILPGFAPSPAKAPKVVRCCNGVACLAVAVGAGSFHDPKDISGLAHLVEHSVFLGSKQFTTPNQLFIEVVRNGGTVNATTYSEQTLFYLSGLMEKFEDCVRMLVDGIIHPNLDEEAVNNEIKSLRSECNIKQPEDVLKLTDFTRSKKGHPMGGFYWENKKSLTYPFIIKRMKEWIRMYYKASNMTLCIQAPTSIEEIEKIVLEHFSSIPSSSGPKSSLIRATEIASCGNPFDAREKKNYFIVPVRRYSCLEISWSLSAEFWKDYDYEAKPLYYIRTVLNCVGKGGLIDCMKKRGWIAECQDLSANCSCTDYYCKSSFGSQFILTVILTDKGYDKKDDVVEAIFSYLKYLHKSGANELYFDEMKKTQSNAFHFQNWEDIMGAGKLAALALQHVQPKHVFTSQKLLTRFSKEAIENCLNLLKPRNACFLFASHKNLNLGSDMKKACESGVMYMDEEITEERYEKLENIDPFHVFQEYPKGAFLAKEIRLVDEGSQCCSKSEDGIYEVNSKLVMYQEGEWTDNPCAKISGKVPSAMISLAFSSPAMIEQPKLEKGVLFLWLKLVQDKITQSLGSQYDHLFAYDLSMDKEGITIYVTGPSCHCAELAAEIVQIVFMEPSELCKYRGDFDNLKMKLFRNLVDDIFDVETLADQSKEFILKTNYVPSWEMKDVIGALDVTEFIELIKNFSHCMKVIVQIQGAVYQEGLENLKKAIKSIKYTEYTTTRQLSPNPDQCTKLPNGTSKLRLAGFYHPAYACSAVINFYQFGNELDDVELYSMYKLSAFMRRRIVSQLKTRDQLGYTVILRASRQCGVAGLSVLVLTQPKVHATTDKVEKRIDNFLEKFYQIYLRDAEEPSQSLFKKKIQTREQLQKLKKFYEDYLLPTGKNFKKLSVIVGGEASNQKLIMEQLQALHPGNIKDELNQKFDMRYILPTDLGKSKDTQCITNVNEFKKSLDLYPSVDDSAM